MLAKENVIEPTGEAKGPSWKAQRAPASEPAAALGDVPVPVAKAPLLGGLPGGRGEKAFGHRQGRRPSPAAPHGSRGRPRSGVGVGGDGAAAAVVGSPCPVRPRDTHFGAFSIWRSSSWSFRSSPGAEAADGAGGAEGGPAVPEASAPPHSLPCARRKPLGDKCGRTCGGAWPSGGGGFDVAVRLVPGSSRCVTCPPHPRILNSSFQYRLFS